MGHGLRKFRVDTEGFDFFALSVIKESDNSTTSVRSLLILSSRFVSSRVALFIWKTGNFAIDEVVSIAGGLSRQAYVRSRRRLV